MFKCFYTYICMIVKKIFKKFEKKYYKKNKKLKLCFKH